MSPLEHYLRELAMIHASGAAVPETSYYGPLANLLNAVGATLRPAVHCVIQLRNRGAGVPARHTVHYLPSPRSRFS